MCCRSIPSFSMHAYWWRSLAIVVLISLNGCVHLSPFNKAFKSELNDQIDSEKKFQNVEEPAGKKKSAICRLNKMRTFSLHKEYRVVFSSVVLINCALCLCDSQILWIITKKGQTAPIFEWQRPPQKPRSIWQVVPKSCRKVPMRMVRISRQACVFRNFI